MLAMFMVPLGVFSGLITPVQTAVNTRLGRSIGSPLRASLVSFSVGLLAMLTLTLLIGPYPLIPAAAFQSPWWMWLAGVFGVTFLTGNVLLLPKLGSLKTVIMPVTGQIIMGLLIDVFGWFGTRRQTIAPLRIVGTVLALVGFLIAVAGGQPQKHASKSVDRRDTVKTNDSITAGTNLSIVLWSCAGIGFGMCSAIQTALLGRLGTALHSPVKASLASFTVGLAALALVVGLKEHTFSLGDAPKTGNPWWMWIGGLLGATLVMCNSYLSAHIGTGLTVMLVLLGQVGGGLVVDRFGLLGVPRRHVAVAQYGGVAIAIVGIILRAL